MCGLSAPSSISEPWVRRCSSAGFALRHAETADSEKLERGALHVDAECEAEQVQLEPFLPADHDAGESQQRELNTGAAWREPCQSRAGKIILAYGGRRQLEPEARDGAADIRRERVAVRARPRPVARGIGIGFHRRLDVVDQLVDSLSAAVDQDLRAAAEPVIVGA